MSATKTYTFPLDQFSQGGKDLLAHAQKHPAMFGVCTVLIAAGLVTIIVPLAIGFTTAGPAPGSAAVAWQASIGNVAAGSLFAALQTMTMNGTLMAAGGGLIGVGALGLAVRSVDWAEVAKGAEWAGREAWVRAEEAAKAVDWAEVAKGAEWAGKETAKSAEWAGREACVRAEEAVKAVDWAEVAKGAEWAGKEALVRAEEAAKAVDWAGIAKSANWVFGWK